MKKALILALPLALNGSLRAQQGEQTRFRDAATHESLLPLFKKAQQSPPASKFTPSEGEDPTVTNRPSNLIERSDVISFNGHTTLIPKHAIIQTPANYKDRINNHVPGNRIVTWGGFYPVNRGWITTVEVSRLQAEGKEPISPEIVEMYSKSRNLVVATFKGGPISVLPPKEENPIQTASQESEK